MRAESVIVRVADDAKPVHAFRVVAAALAAGAKPILSVGAAVPAGVVDQIRTLGLRVTVEDSPAWQSRLQKLAAETGPNASYRVRVVAGDSREQEVADVFAATGGKPDIAVYGGPVVTAGRVEILPHLREQAVSITAHRFGTLNGISEGLI